jgi:3',5'-cyclic AMP phosphodiesterase CpdA
MNATTGITRIAHLSDAHVLDPRPSRTRAGWSMRTRFLSIGRPLDAVGRQRKLRRALDGAKRVGAHHVVISGDLTEIGSPGEYETLAEILHDSGIPPERMTLVPGNHDLYSSADGWRWALEGPLAAYAAASAGEAGKVVDIGAATLMPIDATFHQPVTRSAGWMSDETLDLVQKRCGDAARTGKPLVVVQHHPPFERTTSALHWLDGLVGAARMMSVLETFRNLFVLHGHLHYVIDRTLSCGVHRILGATAVVDDRDAARVRIYDVRDGELRSSGLVMG